MISHLTMSVAVTLSIGLTFTELLYVILLLLSFTARKNDDYTLWQRNICYKNSHEMFTYKCNANY